MLKQHEPNAAKHTAILERPPFGRFFFLEAQQNAQHGDSAASLTKSGDDGEGLWYTHHFEETTGGRSPRIRFRFLGLVCVTGAAGFFVGLWKVLESLWLTKGTVALNHKQLKFQKRTQEQPVKLPGYAI